MTQNGAFTVANAAVEVPAITLAEAPRYAVTLALTYDGETPADTAVTICLDGAAVATSTESTIAETMVMEN